MTTLPLDYTGNKCLTANSSSLKASKCACDFNGCNMDPMMTNMSLNDFSASWSNDTRTNLSSNYSKLLILYKNRIINFKISLSFQLLDLYSHAPNVAVLASRLVHQLVLRLHFVQIRRFFV